MDIDYVIVGAGSAGCVLADRLSRDPDTTVLLLEAGGSDRHLNVSIPAAFAELFGTKRDWGLHTEPEPQLGGRRLYWPRGRMLGGSSSMNAMIYVRGHPRDYDGWAADGCTGWSYREVLPYFRRAEDNARGADRHHGDDGPLRVADLRDPNPLSEAFLAAAEARGLPRNDDFNASSQEGVGLYQVTQRSGARHSAASAYLRPAGGRDNLIVRTGVQAGRVVVEDGRAIGVEARVDGDERRMVRADREVLLAAGSVGSPQILQRSGIGDPDLLRRHDVPVVAARPGVGRNLQDHPAVGLIWLTDSEETLDDADKPRYLLQWLTQRSGKLTSNVGEAGGFVRLGDEAPAPDLQLHFAPAFYHDHGRSAPPGRAVTLAPTLLQPASRGRIEITGRDPRLPPAIHAGYLDDGADRRTLLDGCRLGLEIAAQDPLAQHLGDRHLPRELDDDGLRAHLRDHLQTLYHPVGTCRMGPRDEAATVVDPRLRVVGVGGLRVVDASVMPRIPRGNTNAPTIMLAERAADLIRGRRPLPPAEVS